MSSKKVEKDERTTYVENQSYRYGYLVLSFGILIDILYRSIQFNEDPWDLFAVIFLGGLITMGHQYRNRILTGQPLTQGLFLQFKQRFASSTACSSE